jgi:WD40 repeat protein
LWDLRTLAQIRDLHGLRGGTCQSVAFSPDGTRLAGSENSIKGDRIRVWDVAHGTLTPYRTTTADVASIAYSPDGRLLAAAAYDHGTEIRSAATGALVKRMRTGDYTRAVAFSPDSKLVAASQFNGSIVLYSTADWKAIGRPLVGPTLRVTYVQFTPDSRTLIAAGADGAVRLWDVASQKPIGAPLQSSPSAYMAAALTPDGRYLFAAPPSGPGIRFDMSPGSWNAHACLVAGRDITPHEWADALPGRGYRHICRS